MADHIITDFVSPDAIAKLKELKSEMIAVKDAYVNVARELIKGLDIKVNNLEDLQKLADMYAKSQKAAAEATERLTKAQEEERKVLGQTSNEISRNLAETVKVNKANYETYTRHQQVREILAQTNESYANNVKRLVEVNLELQKLNKAKAEEKKMYEQGARSQSQYEAALANIVEAQRALQVEKSKLNGELSREEKLNATSSTSYDAMSQQLQRLKRAYRELDEEGRNTEIGKNLLNEIDQLSRHLKDLDASMGEYQRNVGDYAIAGQGVRKELKQMVADIADLTVAYRSMSTEEQNSAQGQALKQHIAELTQQAGVLKDAMMDTQAAIVNEASDTKGLDQITEGINLIIDGFGLAQGAAAMLGLSEEDLVEVQTKLQAAIAASNAMQGIQNALQKQSSIMLGITSLQTWAAKKAKDAETASTVKATVAQGVFNMIAKANPYVLLAAAVVTVVGALAAFTLGSKKATEAEKAHQDELKKARETQNKYNSEIAKSVGDTLSKYELLRRSWKMLTSEQQKNKWIKDNASGFKQLGLNIKNVVDADKVFVKMSTEVIQALKLRAEAKALENLYVEEYQKKIERETKGTVKNGQYYETFKAGDTVSMETISKNNLKDSGRDYTKQGLFGAYTLTDEGAAKLTENARKSAQAIREGLEEPLKKYGKALEEAEKKAMTAEGKLGSLIGTDDSSEKKNKKEKKQVEDINKIKLKAIQDQIAIEKEGSDQWLNLKEKEIALRQQMELEGIKDTEMRAAQDNTIRLKYLKEYEDAEQKHNDLILEERQARFAAEQVMADEAYMRRMIQLKEQYAAELEAAGGNTEARAKAQRNYDNAVSKTDEQYSIETAKRQIAALEMVLQNDKMTAEQRKQLEMELAQARLTLEDSMADAAINANERIAQSDEELKRKRIENAEKWMSVAMDGFSAIAGLASAIYDGQLQSLKEEQDALDKKYEEDTARNEEAAAAEEQIIQDLVDRKVITEEEGEARKRAAAANTAAKQKKLDEDKAKRDEEIAKKQADIKTKQAIWDKAQQIAQVAMNTATAIMRCFSDAGPFAGPGFAAIVGAMGAIQLATILATPIPKYKEGTDSHKGGLAIVGDGGKMELVEYGGRMFLTPDTPTLVDMPKGAKVYPDAEDIANGLMSLRGIDGVSGSIEMVFDTKKLEAKMDRNSELLDKILRQYKKNGKGIANALADAQYQQYKAMRI